MKRKNLTNHVSVKKSIAERIAISLLSVGMAFSTVPATSVFADVTAAVGDVEYIAEKGKTEDEHTTIKLIKVLGSPEERDGLKGLKTTATVEDIVSALNAAMSQYTSDGNTYEVVAVNGAAVTSAAGEDEYTNLSTTVSITRSTDGIVQSTGEYKIAIAVKDSAKDYTKNRNLKFTESTFTKPYNSALVDNTTETGVSEDKDKDNTYDLSALLDSDGTDELKWSSSNESVAIVDQNGLVTLKGVGTASITVDDVDNANLSASITVNATGKYVFDDVQDDKKYYFSAVEWATRNGVTAGISKTEFGITREVTRADFLTWMWRAAGSPKTATTSKFTDVDPDKYYAQAVAWGVQNGITAGTSDTTFSPKGKITREQAVTFLYRRFGGGETYNAKVPFTDVKETSYAYTAIQWAVDAGVTAGKTATSFAPKDNVLRTDGITFLYKADNFYNGQ